MNILSDLRQGVCICPMDCVILEASEEELLLCGFVC